MSIVKRYFITPKGQHNHSAYVNQKKPFPGRRRQFFQFPQSRMDHLAQNDGGIVSYLCFTPGQKGTILLAMVFHADYGDIPGAPGGLTRASANDLTGRE